MITWSLAVREGLLPGHCLTGRGDYLLIESQEGVITCSLNFREG